MPAGAYRGYGATQGLFAVESAVNELADRLGMDPCEIRLKNLVTPGERLAQYDDNELYSCNAADCLRRAMEMIGWADKPLRQDLGDRVRGLGVALSMQGSAIAKIDIGSVDLRVEETGFYTLSIGATDMGTGCDTILAQFAAEALRCDTDRIVVHGVDTDVSPFDTGSYASASTYLTGMAVLKAAEQLIAELRRRAAGFMGVDVNDVLFDGDTMLAFAPGTLEVPTDGDKPEFSGIYDDVEAIARSYHLAQAAPDAEPVAQMSLIELANKLVAGGDGDCLTAHAAASSPTSPPPFMSGIAEVDVDKATGKVSVVDYVSVVDCGTVVNENLARVQAEGGIGQGIGMALTEDVQYSDTGRMRTRSFMTYKVPHAPRPAEHPRGVRAELRAHRPLRRQVHRRGGHQHAVAGYRKRCGARDRQLRAHAAHHARESPVWGVTDPTGRTEAPHLAAQAFGRRTPGVRPRLLRQSAAPQPAVSVVVAFSTHFSPGEKCAAWLSCARAVRESFAVRTLAVSGIMHKLCVNCGRGGIGRRAGFRFQWASREGSSPFARTSARTRFIRAFGTLAMPK